MKRFLGLMAVLLIAISPIISYGSDDVVTDKTNYEITVDQEMPAMDATDYSYSLSVSPVSFHEMFLEANMSFDKEYASELESIMAYTSDSNVFREDHDTVTLNQLDRHRKFCYDSIHGNRIEPIPIKLDSN